jgi:hypothetical protein
MIARPPLPSEAPSGFPPRRWANCAAMLPTSSHRRGRRRQPRFGWTDLDLFGVDADRPYTRIDGLGLVLALDARSA